MGAETPPAAASALVDWLLTTIRPLLPEAFPSVQIHPYEGPAGSLTALQAHEVGVEATFPSGDCVALCVTVAYLTTTPRVIGEVWSDAARGALEATTSEGCHSSEQWPLASPENLASIEQALPRLVDALRAAIDRCTSPPETRDVPPR